MSKIAILVLNQSPISAVFQIVWLPGDQKTALTEESLYPTIPIGSGNGEEAPGLRSPVFRLVRVPVPFPVLYLVTTS